LDLKQWFIAVAIRDDHMVIEAFDEVNASGVLKASLGGLG
jgi:hypothetical protein